MKKFYFVLLTDKDVEKKAIKYCQTHDLDYDVTTRWLKVDGLIKVKMMGLVSKQKEYKKLVDEIGGIRIL